MTHSTAEAAPNDERSGGGHAHVLIVNALLANGGDAALVTGLHRGLRGLGVTADIMTLSYGLVRDKYPELPLAPDRGSSRLFVKLPWLRTLMAPVQLRRTPGFRRAAAVLGCPGGYMNSFYGVGSKLSVLRAAKASGRATGIYAQSFGPFSDADAEAVRRSEAYVDAYVVRDERGSAQI